MQAVYQLDVQGADILPQLGYFFRENSDDDLVCRLAWDWTKGTWDSLDVCDGLIVESTIKWKLSRLSPVDRSILRLSVYQMRFCSDIPPRVVINEAIEMAKKFSSEKSVGFVNGVLDAVLKKTGTDKLECHN